MPMWHVHCPRDVYNPRDKRDFAGRVTDLYVDRAGLPRFYVVVRFHEYDPDSLFVGGEPRSDFVRIWMDHIARETTDPDRRRAWMSTVNRQLAPLLSGRGLHSEIHVDDTPMEFWTIDGHFPPPAGSAEERRWAKENRPSPAGHTPAGALVDG